MCWQKLVGVGKCVLALAVAGVWLAGGGCARPGTSGGGAGEGPGDESPPPVDGASGENTGGETNGESAVGGVEVGHLAAAELESVPADTIAQIKSDLHVWFGHTSHGSQIVTGMDMLAEQDSRFEFTRGPGELLEELEGMDLGHVWDLPDMPWVDATREALDQPGSAVNVVMWSWCAGVSDNTEEGIRAYLDAMETLEADYPGVTFVYMTGHLDGSGRAGTLHARNNQIRDYCRANNKVLFDFADVESYDPDGNYYPDDTDACQWCDEWCAENSCPTCEECAHSACFNCYQKGRAFWWMLSRLVSRDRPALDGAGDEVTAADDTGDGTTGATGEDIPGLPGGGSSVAELIQPADLEYRGAFRLPDGDYLASWEWAGTGLAYYAEGDPGGPEDGYPGSLFGTGHEHAQQISEIAIPVPVVSTNHNLEDLNTAATLQDFRDVRGMLGVDSTALELPRAGLACLPPQGAQATSKLYFCWGEHYQFERAVSHGWCETDLTDPAVAGGWYVGELSNYSTDDYMFEIPSAWAGTYASGMRIGTGRFRDGGWSGQGPSLIAIGPWLSGDPPPAGTELGALPLLLYTSSEDWEADAHTMNDYHHSDEWSGGAWLTTRDASAVIFVGTKGVGDCWYGFANGVVWPDEAPFPPIPDPPYDQRGWWSTGFEARIIFYDPAELAAVATGEWEPYHPQPYARLDIGEHLFAPDVAIGKYQLGAAAFDDGHDLLYVTEFRGDDDKCLVHVWHVGG